MPTEKHRKRPHNESITNENDNHNFQTKSQLFNEADAKAAEISGYTTEFRTHQTHPQVTERMLPTGVVDIDETVQLPASPGKTPNQRRNSKQHAILHSTENQHKENIHLPAINNRSHQHHHHHPYDSLYPQSGSYSPVGYDYHSPHHRHHHHHHHHHHSHHGRSHTHHSHRHHRHHHRHEHEREVETYDSRWWYLPLNTVHAPKSRQSPEYHYVARKWYEPSSKEGRISIETPVRRTPLQKYPDCRCEVCKPSKVTPRGVKWVVNA